MFNFTGVVHAFKVLANPSLCLPHATVSTFDQLPIPLSHAFPPSEKGQYPEIRAVVLDKDNCFAIPKENEIHGPYTSHFRALQAHYPDRVLIVSNTAGLAGADPTGTQAAALTRATHGTPVLAHATPKPGCGAEVLAALRARGIRVDHPGQVAVVGDRLLTDVLMANEAGMRAVWVRDGVVPPRGPAAWLVGAERGAEAWLRRRGWEPPRVESPFE